MFLFLFPYRFRRERQHTADVEKGDGKDAKDGETSQAKKLSTTEEGGTTVAKTRPGKWGRLLGKIKNKKKFLLILITCN